MTAAAIMRFLLCLLSLGTAMASCSSNTCDHGSCVNGKCQCEPNFGFPDCSVPFQTCPDGQRDCFNGSECVRNNQIDPVTGEYKYHCDCTKAYGVSPFAGLQCEQAATSYCVEGGSTSEYAFCTNGGECVRMVARGSPHPGCICNGDFEGMHCQYDLGEAPAVDLGQPYQMMVSGEQSSNMGGVAVFFIVIVSIGFVVGVGYVIYRKRRTTNEREDPNSEMVDQSRVEGPTIDIT